MSEARIEAATEALERHGWLRGSAEELALAALAAADAVGERGLADQLALDLRNLLKFGFNAMDGEFAGHAAATLARYDAARGSSVRTQESGG